GGMPSLDARIGGIGVFARLSAVRSHMLRRTNMRVAHEVRAALTRRASPYKKFGGDVSGVRWQRPQGVLNGSATGGTSVLPLGSMSACASGSSSLCVQQYVCCGSTRALPSADMMLARANAFAPSA